MGPWRNRWRTLIKVTRKTEIHTMRLAIKRWQDSIDEAYRIEQTLAQALGYYPWYKDDQENFPGATEEDGVCCGEMTAEDLAIKAAKEIKELREQLNLKET